MELEANGAKKCLGDFWYDVLGKLHGNINEKNMLHTGCPIEKYLNSLGKHMKIFFSRVIFEWD